MAFQKAPPLVLVEWLDSRLPSSSWQHTEAEDDLPTICKCISVGFLLERDETRLVLAPHLADWDTFHDRQAAGLIPIPICSVESITELKE